MEASERKKIIRLIKREVVPAIGCTEPIAVALAVAKAAEALGARPETVAVSLSANILKNAMGVGIPGTGMIGLPIAVALGALAGKPSYQLEVLKDITPADVEEGKAMIARRAISICLKEDCTEKLYIEASCRAGGQEAVAVISGGHTRFVYVARGGQVLLDKRAPGTAEGEEERVDLSMRKVYDFATTAPLDEIRFILKAAELNRNAAEQSFKGDYGHALGKTMRGVYEHRIMGDSVFSHILSYTSAACDARMAGAMIPVMSNSGSGNQGIAATLPVVVYALCGCVVAATGSSCGITWLMGGGYPEVASAVKNMVANLTGMICDGAKPSCAMKLTSGVSTAVMSAMLAMEGKCAEPVEGIIDDDVDQTIRNLTLIGSRGMDETDRLVLRIMTSK